MAVDRNKVQQASFKLDRIINGIDVCDEESQKLAESLISVRDQLIESLEN